MITLGLGFLVGCFVGLVFGCWYPLPRPENAQLQKYLAFHLARTNRLLLKEQDA